MDLKLIDSKQWLFKIDDIDKCPCLLIKTNLIDLKCSISLSKKVQFTIISEKLFTPPSTVFLIKFSIKSSIGPKNHVDFANVFDKAPKYQIVVKEFDSIQYLYDKWLVVDGIVYMKVDLYTRTNPSDSITANCRFECPISIDSIVKKLLSPHQLTGKLIIPHSDVTFICSSVQQLFLRDESLMDLHGKFVVIGDLHGQYFDLLRIFKKFGFPNTTNYLFLGDYVDRGPDSIHILILLFAFKVLYPHRIFMIRGNHECELVCEKGGFKNECEFKGANFIEFINVFNTLPIAARLNKKMICIHGGISPLVFSLQDIKSFPRPSDIGPLSIYSDLVWSDPNSKINEFGKSVRGPCSTFGQKALHRFLDENGLDIMVRAHEIPLNGFDFPFSFDGRIVTVFSSIYLYNDNIGSVMIVDENACFSFDVFTGLSKEDLATFELVDFGQFYR